MSCCISWEASNADAPICQTTFACPAASANRFCGGGLSRTTTSQAVVGRPELLLLDEPLANLDLRSQQEIVSLLGTLASEHGLTVVVVVHDLNPLLPLLTSAVYLLDGHAHHDAIGEVVDRPFSSCRSANL